jgi:hypothetical protein
MVCWPAHVLGAPWEHKATPRPQSRCVWALALVLHRNCTSSVHSSTKGSSEASCSPRSAPPFLTAFWSRRHLSDKVTCRKGEWFAQPFAKERGKIWSPVLMSSLEWSKGGKTEWFAGEDETAEGMLTRPQPSGSMIPAASIPAFCVLFIMLISHQVPAPPPPIIFAWTF